MLVWLNEQLNERFRAIRKRLFGNGKNSKVDAARSIRRERETFRRWSRRSIEDRFTL